YHITLSHFSTALRLTFFFLSSYGTLLSVHSFPTRRSSDLVGPRITHVRELVGARHVQQLEIRERRLAGEAPVDDAVGAIQVLHRSEEHTSELQSRSDLVCRLLLEKKKKNKNSTSHKYTQII